MGAEARFICFTCKTICYADGSRNYWGGKEIPPIEELEAAIGAARIVAKYISPHYYDTQIPIKFLEMLVGWLRRHQGHKISITSDYGMDMGDWEDYKTESVDGKVATLTREEENEEACRQAKEANTERIKGIIKKYPLHPEDAAPEIADLFIYPYGY